MLFRKSKSASTSVEKRDAAVIFSVIFKRWANVMGRTVPSLRNGYFMYIFVVVSPSIYSMLHMNEKSVRCCRRTAALTCYASKTCAVLWVLYGGLLRSIKVYALLCKGKTYPSFEDKIKAATSRSA